MCILVWQSTTWGMPLGLLKSIQSVSQLASTRVQLITNSLIIPIIVDLAIAVLLYFLLNVKQCTIVVLFSIPCIYNSEAKHYWYFK